MKARPLAVVAGLMLLLTYFLLQSRMPDQATRARMQEALQSLQLHDAELNRDVLMARAGLLPNYDSLARTARSLSRDVETLQTASQALTQEAADTVEQEVNTLAAALKEKLSSIEYLKSDNALLRNSIAYFGQSMRSLRARGDTGEPAMAVAAFSDTMLRFVQTRDAVVQKEAEAALARISAMAVQDNDLQPLAVHGRFITDVLPKIDALLNQILTSPTAAREEMLQDAILAYDRRNERRAHLFRLLLYLVALLLLGYGFLVFARLRARARELRRKEMQLIQANKMTSLGTLVSGVAHEINNPNQVVLLNSGVLANAWDDAVDVLDRQQGQNGEFTLAGLPYAEMREAVSQLIREVHEGARRIDQIIGDLKDFARPPAPVSKVFSLNDVVRRALRLLVHVIQRKTDHFETRLAEDLPELEGNPQQLEQIVVNLVINALEALPDRKGSVLMTTFFDADHNSVVLEVQDSGVGISRENLPRLGEPFFTTKETSGGTGLGIAIASSLVRLHHGRLEFDSDNRQGTRARVELSCLARVQPSSGAQEQR